VTKLEELKAAEDAARGARDAAYADAYAAYDTWDAAWVVYHAELKRTQEESPSD
tara:strand:- start:250 stop:411 length:162 start_codon:yes stop_codon:yes gene_type:complete